MSNTINDWKKCIFCQKRQKGSKKEKPRLAPEGLAGASKLISEFIERNTKHQHWIQKQNFEGTTTRKSSTHFWSVDI